LKNKFLFSVFVYFIILVLFSLGSWQLYRLNWKLDLINQIEQSLKSSPIELSNIDKKNYLRIKTSGKIDFEKQIYLYNLNESGKPGFEVINPILINNENYLINRGWIPFDKKDRSEINYINQNDIIGTLKTQSKANSFKPQNDIQKNYWFTLDREDIFEYTGKEFSKYIIYLNGDYKLPKPKVITAKISNNHKKYAITWFSMAISILLIYLYFRKKNY
jgi:surfeit locus 1 family protein